MPKTAEEGFRTLLNKLVPNAGEHTLAVRHRGSIRSCLERNFECSRFFETGSFGNHTGVRHYSDVDYFAGIPARYAHKNSATLLANVRSALGYTFPATGVKVSCPAVNLPFGKYASETVEVTPACFNGFASYNKKSFANYRIPDCNGGWQNSSPDAHNYYVSRINERLGYKVKPLIQLVKAWNYYKQAKIKSFYLELRVASYVSSRASIDYGRDMASLFNHLMSIELRRMRDPTGISGEIVSWRTENQHTTALSKLQTAATRALKAQQAARQGKLDEAFHYWNLLFADNFPAR